MSTPRKRPGIVVSEYLKSADAALATANIRQHDARETRKEAAKLIETIIAAQERLLATDVKRYPDAVVLLIRRMKELTTDYRLLLAEANAQEAEALMWYETARRFFSWAQTAYKEEF